MRHASIEKGKLEGVMELHGEKSALEGSIFGSDCFLHHGGIRFDHVIVLFGHWDLGLAAFESGWV